MKKVFYSLTICIFALMCTSCNKEENNNNTGKDTAARAAALGFSDVKAYELKVAEACASGNHENCDILTDGTHQACAYTGHSGKNHDGTSHNGMTHGTHDVNGHNHEKGNGGHNGGGHHK